MTLTKPNHFVKWYLNGKEIAADNDRFKLEKIDDKRFKLNINNLEMSDQGQVKCVILNDKGEEVSNSTCNLNVEGKFSYLCLFI